jgi:hypothetical protein
VSWGEEPRRRRAPRVLEYRTHYSSIQRKGVPDPLLEFPGRNFYGKHREPSRRALATPESYCIGGSQCVQQTWIVGSAEPGTARAPVWCDVRGPRRILPYVCQMGVGHSPVPDAYQCVRDTSSDRVST